MLLELFLFTAVSLAASILPIYKVRNGLSRIFTIPFVGIILSLIYSLGVSYIMLTVFAFQSSVAGLANMLSAVLFTFWMMRLGNGRKNVTS